MAQSSLGFTDPDDERADELPLASEDRASTNLKSPAFQLAAQPTPIPAPLRSATPMASALDGYTAAPVASPESRDQNASSSSSAEIPDSSHDATAPEPAVQAPRLKGADADTDQALQHIGDQPEPINPPRSGFEDAWLHATDERQRQNDAQQAGIHAFLKSRGVETETLPDGSQTIATHPDGAPVWKPATSSPFQDPDSGQWIVRQRDDHGNLRDVSALDVQGAVHTDAKTGDQYVYDANRQPVKIGTDQAIAAQIAIHAQRSFLYARENQAAAQIADLNASLTPVREQFHAMQAMPATESDGLGGKSQSIKQVENTIVNLQAGASKDPAVQEQLKSKIEARAKFYQDNPTYSQIQATLASGKEQVRSLDADRRRDRDTRIQMALGTTSAAVQSTLPDTRPTTGNQGAVGDADPAEVAQNAAVATGNGTPQTKALVGALRQMKASGAQTVAGRPIDEAISAAVNPPARPDPAPAPEDQKPPDTGPGLFKNFIGSLMNHAQQSEDAIKAGGKKLLGMDTTGDKQERQWRQELETGSYSADNPYAPGGPKAGITLGLNPLMPAVPRISLGGDYVNPKRQQDVATGLAHIVPDIAGLVAAPEAMIPAMIAGGTAEGATQAEDAGTSQLKGAALGGAKTGLTLALFGGSGKIAGKLLPAIEAPLARGLAAAGISAPVNAAVDVAVNKLFGGNAIPQTPAEWTERLGMALFFAGHAGVHEAHVPDQIRTAQEKIQLANAQLAMMDQAKPLAEQQGDADTVDQITRARDSAQKFLKSQDPKLVSAIDAKVKAAADLAKSAVDSAPADPVEAATSTARAVTDTLRKSDILQRKAESLPADAPLEDRDQLNQRQQAAQDALTEAHGTATEAVPEVARKAIAASLGSRDEAVQAHFDQQPDSAFQAAHVGAQLRDLYATPHQRAQVDGIVARVGEHGPTAQFIADQHVGMKAAKDLTAIAALREVPPERVAGLQRLGLVETENGQPMVTHDALPLLPKGMTARLIGSHDAYRVKSLHGEKLQGAAAMVRAGQGQLEQALHVKALAIRPAAEAVPHLVRVQFTNKAGKSGETLLPVKARSEEEATANAIARVQKGDVKVTHAEVTTKAKEQARQKAATSAPPDPLAPNIATTAKLSDFTPAEQQFANLVGNEYRRNQKYLEALGISKVELVRNSADRSGLSVSDAGALQLDASQLKTQADTFSKQGVKAKEWARAALQEEAWHAIQFKAAEQAGVDWKTHYADLHSALSPEMLARAREVYTDFDSLPKHAQAAEVERMILQNKWNGTITEKFVASIERILAYLKGLKIESPLLKESIARVEAVREEVLAKAKEVEATRPTPESTQSPEARTPDATSESAQSPDDETGTGDQTPPSSQDEGRSPSPEPATPAPEAQATTRESLENDPKFDDVSGFFKAAKQGTRADYDGYKGTLQRDDQGRAVIVTDEGAHVEIPPEDQRLGAGAVTLRDPMVEVDEDGKVSLNGKPYEFVRSNVGADGTLESVTVKNAAGREQTVDNQRQAMKIAMSVGNARAENRTPVNAGNATRAKERDQMTLFASRAKAQTNTPEFKKWFGKSVVADKEGSPLMMAHSTNAGEFDTFKTANLSAHFGTQQAAKDRAEALRKFSEETVGRKHEPARTLPVFLKIESPLRLPDLASLTQTERGDIKPITEAREEWLDSMTAEDRDAWEHPNKYEGDVKDEIEQEYGSEPRPMEWESDTDFAEVLRDKGLISADEFWDVQYDKDAAVSLLREKGYDGIQYRNDVEDAGSDSYIVFDPQQIKSADANRGTFDSNDANMLHSARAQTAAQKEAERLAKLRETRAGFAAETGAAPDAAPEPHVLTKPEGRTVINAYHHLAQKTGFPAVSIADLADQSGIPLDRLKQQLVRSEKAGSVVLSTGDWSLSSDKDKTGVIESNGQKMLQVRFLNDAGGMAAAKAQTKTPAFKKWFGESKVVNEKGEPKPVYHGTNAEFSQFEHGHTNTVAPQAGTAFFFSDTPDVAGSYGTRVHPAFLRIENPLTVDKSLSTQEVTRGGKNLKVEQTGKYSDGKRRWVVANEDGGWISGKAHPDRASAEAEIESGRRFAVSVDGIPNPEWLSGKMHPSREAADAELAANAHKRNYTGVEMAQIIEHAKANGHDGVIFKNIEDASYERHGPQTVYAAFDPEQIKSATANRGTFDPSYSPQKDASLHAAKAKEQDRLGFYSHLSRVAEAKLPNRAAPEQILATLKGSGVKPAEMDWMGLPQFLEGKASVTKDEMHQFIAENRVKMREVVKGDGRKPVEQAELDKVADDLDRIDSGDFWDFTDSNDTKAVEMGDKAEGAIREASDALRAGDHERAMGLLRYAGQLESDFGDDPTTSHLRKKLERLTSEEAQEPDTKFSQYALPGGTNYKEVLLTLPDAAKPPKTLRAEYKGGGEYEILDDALHGAKRGTVRAGTPEEAVSQWWEKSTAKAIDSRNTNFHSSHWDEPNVLAHIRQADHTDTEGNKVRLIEEAQSDWLQQARKHGFKDDVDPKELAEMKAEHRRLDDLLNGPIPALNEAGGFTAVNAERMALSHKIVAADKTVAHGVPKAPFLKTWHEVLIKRALRDAVDSGMDKLAWVTGDIAADRFDLSKTLSRIDYKKQSDGKVWIRPVDLEGNYLKELENSYEPAKLVDVIGKDVAEKIATGEDRGSISGDNLKAGGAGMRGFYDKILPDFVRKYVKPFGASVEETTLADGTKVHSVRITDAMRDSVQNEGQALFASKAVAAAHAKVAQAIAPLRDEVKTAGAKREIAQDFDATGNEANKAGVQATNHIRLPFERPIPKGETGAQAKARVAAVKQDLVAARPVVEAGGSKARLAAELAKVNASTDAKLREKFAPIYQYALDNFDRLNRMLAAHTKLANENYDSLKAAGVDVGKRADYVHRVTTPPEDPNAPHLAFEMGNGNGSGNARGMLKGRSFDTMGDAIKAGYDPGDYGLHEADGHMVQNSTRIIGDKAFLDKMKQVKAPTDGKPIIGQLVKRRLANGETDLKVPDGYTSVNAMGRPLVIHKMFAPLFRDLYGSSAIRNFAAGRALLKLAAAGKHGTLVFDTFHVGRLLYKMAAGGGGSPLTVRDGKPAFNYHAGLSLLEYSDKDLDVAHRQGEITADEVKYARKHRAALDELVKAGLNVGKVSDNLIEQAHLKIPGLTKMNDWIFGKLSRGAMVQTALAFHERNLARPGMTREQAARRTATEMNEYFGNLQNQGIFKSKTLQDIARLVFLAPNWTESQARYEARAYGQLGASAVDAARGKGLRAGNATRAMATGFVALLAANQVANYLSRGQSTFQNEEDGHKLDAWVPGGKRGFWFNPFEIAGEYAHAAMKYTAQHENPVDVATHILSNKLSPLGRGVKEAGTGRDAMGRHFLSDTDRFRSAAVDALPSPLPLGSVFEKDPRAPIGYRMTRAPGAMEKQLLQSAGAKVTAAQSPRSQMFALAQPFRPEGQYSDNAGEYNNLRAALDNDQPDAVKTELRWLLDRGKEPKAIAAALGVHANGISPERFTGSVAGEKEMLKNFTPQQMKLYSLAQSEHGANAQKFLEIARSPEGQQIIADARKKAALKKQPALAN